MDENIYGTQAVLSGLIDKSMQFKEVVPLEIGINSKLCEDSKVKY